MKNSCPPGALPAARTPKLDFLALQAGELPPHGRFRHAEGAPCILDADHDLEAVRAWIADRADSKHTQESYYKEISRLYVWAARYAAKPLSGLSREDFDAYLKFLQSIPDDWKAPAAPRMLKNGEPNPSWRPFVGTLSKNSISQSLRVIAAMYTFWHKCGYIVANPLAIRLKKAPRSSTARTQRYLEQGAWEFLLEYIEAMPRDTERERQHAERTRWVIHFAYLSGARLSELAGARMSDFYQEFDVWWLRITGKGKKERLVPASEELITALRRYRSHYDQPGIANRDDETPAILSVTGRSGLTPKSIYLIVKNICAGAAASAEPVDPALAVKLRAASTHWFRHTSASHRANSGLNIRYVQQYLGHADIRTSMIYLHSEDEAFHRELSAQKLRRKNGSE